jgi:hypothetical protein
MGSSLNHVEVLDSHAGWLLGKQANHTSQFGEDGLIEAVFSRIGESNRCCFEVGASDGLLYSNTHTLRCTGWRAVLIEADAELYGRLREQASNKVRTVHERIGACSLDSILAYHGMPRDLDLGVIDIDGQDYWAWDGMRVYRPRVMLVEFAYYREADYIPPLGASDAGEQAGLAAIIGLGEAKGYTAVVKTYCNVLFVDRPTWKATWESN